MDKAYRKVVKSYSLSFAGVILVILISFWIKYLFPVYVNCKILPVLGSGLLLGGTLGYLVQLKILTWKQETKPEKICEGIFIACYLIGTFLITVYII